MSVTPRESTHGHAILRWLSEPPMDHSAFPVRGKQALARRIVLAL